jgi:hypothetical protein
MKKNVGSIDKIIRFIIAIVAIYVSYQGLVQSPWNYVLYAVAGIMILTGLVGTCPIFSVLGIKSNKTSS